MRRHSIWTLLAVAFLAFLARSAFAADALPDPATGGPGGKPISILLIAGDSHPPAIDPKLKKDLEEAGYRLLVVPSFGDYSLGAAYLKQFGVVIITHLPKSADVYRVHGWRTAITFEDNMKAVHEYVAAGGSLLFIPSFGGGGRACVNGYNKFLAPYDVKYRALQVRPAADYEDIYARGVIRQGHPVTAGLEHLLYPATVLRWDNACSSMPVVTGEPWTVLAMAGPDAGTYAVSGNNSVYPGQRSKERNLLAVRTAGKGRVAVCGIQAYYIISHAWQDAKKTAVGESGTGPIAGIVLRGEPEGRPSQFALLLDRLMRWLAAGSAAHGIGDGTDELPEQPPVPDSSLVIDWEHQTLPPTWRHRVIPNRKTWIFDVFPDPRITGDLKYFKALIGPRTAYSSGTGTVAEWRQAAMKAGYSAVMFAETFEDITEEEFLKLRADCEANSDEQFQCLAGLDLQDSQGARYLLLGIETWLDPAWMMPDGKTILRTNFLSLGLGSRKLISYHRPGRSPLHPQMIKHYQGITVATYDGSGKRIDNGLHTYQWQIAADSNPIPIAAHELTDPKQVATAAQSGFQQIMPSDTVVRAVNYFRHPHAHYFACPVRYFISEGPILDGWSIFNKDIKGPELRRDQWRMAVGVRSDVPLDTITLYDRFRPYRRWRPDKESFSTVVHGRHDAQHMFMLVASDTRGRRVISPQIRTVTRNYRLRCGDRQNWLGTQPRWCIYPGWRQIYGRWHLPLRNPPEIAGLWNAPAPIFDFPFYSNHFVMTDIDGSKKYVNMFGNSGLVYGDASPTFAVQDREYTENHVRTLYANPPKAKNLGIMLVETTLRLKRDVEPVIRGGVYPGIRVPPDGTSRLLILPNRKPRELTGRDAGPVPVGSWVGGLIPLTEGLVLGNNLLGFTAPEPDTLSLPRGASWRMQYLRLRGGRYQWRAKGKAGTLDALAETILTQMGLRGKCPYSFKLSRGRFDGLRYFADMTARDGGVAGRLENPADTELLFRVPLRIAGLSARRPAALWRSDKEHLEWFGVHEGTGYVPLDADKSVDFYAGNIVACDPALFVAVVKWTPKEAVFVVNNPTDRNVNTILETVSEIEGRRPLRQPVSVRAGGEVTVEAK